ncbi:MAG: hypothetical protein KDB66_01745 [Solirubrobacterales bacterium]|nr:hypothetical protein [Solirubrobacterales bacterium]MCB8915148.1 hypothetical protein [Thermoleophilales bacterium]
MPFGGKARWGVRSTVALLAAITGLFLAPATVPATAASAKQSSAAKALAGKYVPVMMIRKQGENLCDTKVEQYQVMTVDALFGNPDVRLMRNNGSSKSTLIKQAPTIDDVRNRGEEAYIDLPGDPLGDTCVYSKDFTRMKNEGEAPVAVYAHIAREKGHSGIALQYWFYWYFNQFNDLHESDWEGMQLTFGADTPAGALEEEPSQMILFQHAGGERAKWNDSKVEKEGDHPVVYPAAGSHATFYQSAVYPQNGSHGSGVGCDNTTEPLRELRPFPVLLPDRPTGRGEFAWLSFDGRWGQKEKSFNNGPTGPQTKDQWEEPFTWMEAQRWSSPRMPGGGLVGPEAVNAFCGVIENVTGIMNLQQSEPLLAYAIVIAFFLIVFLVFGYSKWRPADADQLSRQRSYGQIMNASFRLYWRHFKPFAILGAIAIPIVGGTQALGGWLGDMSGGDGLLQALADLVNNFGRPAAQALVSAFLIVFIRELVHERTATVKTALDGTWERFWRVVIAKLLSLLGVTLLMVTVIGIPFAIRFLVNWTFVQQEVLFTDRSIRESFRASSDVVRGHWWRTVRTMVPLLLLLTVLGPLLGLFLIFTPLPLLLVNLIGSVVFAIAIPFTTTGTTLLYFDLLARQEQHGVLPRRSWAFWHPATFGRQIEQPAA